jgi:23S rRNA (cytosine1962-C5)-methyltransferase
MGDARRGGRPPKRGAGRTVMIRAGREKPVLGRHPWVFSGAIESIGTELEPGDIADVVSSTGAFLARGMVNPRSQIALRLLTWDEHEAVDPAFWASRVARAASLRQGAPEDGAVRMIHAESDGLPGLVADRYGDFWVLQVSAAGIERHKADIVRGIAERFSPRGIYERSDVDGRDKEGLPHTVGLLHGEEPPEFISINEPAFDGKNVALLVNVRDGHKTGTYLDQANSRRAVAARSAGGDVLNLFSYTGGFALHAALAGARSVTNVDSSEPALSLSERMAAENGVSGVVSHVRANVFELLRQYKDEGRTFDVVVCDPPKFAHSAAQIDKAARAYKDLSRLAFGLVKPGGHLATFSCSGLVSPDLFQKIVWSASSEAKKDAQIVMRLSQGEDHPVLLAFPEGEYLKGLLVRVL